MAGYATMAFAALALNLIAFVPVSAAAQADTRHDNYPTDSNDQKNTMEHFKTDGRINDSNPDDNWGEIEAPDLPIENDTRDNSEKDINVYEEQKNATDENDRKYKDEKPDNQESSGRPDDGKPGTGHKFPYGQCTWYVAQKRYIPWSGNAGTWLDKARKLGYETGRTPKNNSIAVLNEGPVGHVALVEDINDDQITVSEMNYKGWGQVDHRTITKNDPALKGFIY